MFSSFAVKRLADNLPAGREPPCTFRPIGMLQHQSPAIKPHILVVDDDDRLRDLLRRFLAEQGFIVSTAPGRRGRAKLKSLLRFNDSGCHDAAGKTGLIWPGLCEGACTGAKAVAYSAFNGPGEPNERIEGLGPAPTIIWPSRLSPRELSLRIEAILRRAPAAGANAGTQAGKMDLHVPARRTEVRR